MLKVAVIGPESTGKSELSHKLALYFNGDWVSEYAREYVEQLQRPYNYDDVCNIARYQIEQELRFGRNQEKGYVFFDTELIITKVWFLHCYGECPDFVVQQLNSDFFDLYLLCSPDLPWEPDPVREHGDDRDYFYNWYRSEIEHMKKPYFLIKGTGNQRMQNAIDAIQNFETRKIR
jgi:NadR type nicotinamide-nucleotide adenylyltransferase